MRAVKLLYTIQLDGSNALEQQDSRAVRVRGLWQTNGILPTTVADSVCDNLPEAVRSLRC